MHRLLIAGLLLAGCASKDPAAFITADGLARDVAYLADDRFGGRYSRSPEALQVAEYLAGRFRAAGLEPVAGGAGFFHSVSDESMAPNVVAIRRGRGEDFVLLTAHYDHLKPADTGGDRIFNGADDNASGVSGLLAIADALHAARVTTHASIVFVAFTGEELGLRGARHLAGAPPFALARVRGMFNMDMISRGEADLIIVDGSRNADHLRRLLKQENDRKRVGLRIVFDQHPDWLSRSDQYPFIRRKVPAVLLSVEDHPDYHQVSDEANRILPQLARRVSQLVLAAAVRLANEPPPTTAPAGT